MQPGPIAIGFVIAAALLLTEHVILWSQPWRLTPPWSYIVGVTTLFVGWIAWGMAASGPIAPLDAVANIAVVSSSGSIIVLAYYIRGRIDNARQTDRIVEKAKSLTQAIIDNGGAKHARESDLHDPGSRN